MTFLNWSICSFFLVTFLAMVLLHSSAQESLSLASPRCLSICRRDEESLCKRCLFREPMRFGKRAGTHFREPMRFGKKWDSIREPMRFGKRKNFREPMRFGKRADSTETVGPTIVDANYLQEMPVDATWNNPAQGESLLGMLVTGEDRQASAE